MASRYAMGGRESLAPALLQYNNYDGAHDLEGRDQLWPGDVPAGAVTDLSFDHPYYLAPNGKAAMKGYALLRDALAKSPRWTPKTGHRWTPENRP